jgi:hypothetical protein
LVSVQACWMMTAGSGTALVAEAAVMEAVSSSAQAGRAVRFPWKAGPGPMAATTL